MGGGGRQAQAESKARAGIPTAAKIYIAVFVLLGLGTLVYSGIDFAPQATMGWLALAGLTAVASCLAIRIPVPGGKAGGLAITVGDCFVFVSMLLYGPAAAALTAAIDGLVTSVRCTLGRPERFAFNVAVISLDAYLIGLLFNLLTGSTPPVTGLLSASVLAGLGVSAVTYFLVNSLLVAGGMSLVSGQSLARIWKTHFPWASPSTVANTLAALFLTLALRQADTAVSAAMVALAAVCLASSLLNLIKGRRRLTSQPLA